MQHGVPARAGAGDAPRSSAGAVPAGPGPRASSAASRRRLRAGRPSSTVGGATLVPLGRGGRARGRRARRSRCDACRPSREVPRSRSPAARRSSCCATPTAGWSARLVRRAPAAGRSRVELASPPATARWPRLAVRVENDTDVARTRPSRPRRASLRGARCVGAHLLLASPAAPVRVAAPTRPTGRAEAAAALREPHAAGRCWSARRRAASRALLADHPLRPPGDRAGEPGRPLRLDRDRRDPHPADMTLTDEEKREARGTDPRAAAIIDRCDDHAARGPRAAARRRARPSDATARPSTATTDATTSGDARPGGTPASTRRCRPETDTVLDRRRRGRQGAAGCGCAPAGAPTRRTCSSPGGSRAVEAVCLRRRRRDARRGRARGRPGRRAAELVRPLPLLLPGRGRAAARRRRMTAPRAAACWSPGVGNIFLGDDGFGVEVARRLARRPLPDGVGSWTSASAACTSPTSCSRATTPWSIVDALPARRRARATSSCSRSGRTTSATGELDAHGMAPTAVLASLGRSAAGSRARSSSAASRPTSARASACRRRSPPRWTGPSRW